MTASTRQLRAKGIPTLLTAAVLIAVLLGIDHYLDIRQDEAEARKLMERELMIANLNIMSELADAEIAIDDMGMSAFNHLSEPDQMFGITTVAVQELSFIKAAAIAFTPHFYQEKGVWFEPRSIRRGEELLTEQIGGPGHDYFSMDWYRDGLIDTAKSLKWSVPYIDHSQDDALIMSLTRPLYARHGEQVGVLCIDVALSEMTGLLNRVKPYPGSICQLLDDKGQVMVSSDTLTFDADDYFIGTKAIDKHHLQVRLACPKSAIYGPTMIQDLIALGLMLLGILLLAYIVQRSYRNIMRLNTAWEQQQAVENELRIAHDIQTNMLRHDFPDNLSAVLHPMKEIGGDLYDFYQKDDNLFFIIGDVSGKGLPAAMTMAGIMVLFRMAARHFDTPVEIVSEINHAISERNPDLIFITAFVGKADLRHGLLTYCNAGHNPPVLNGRLLTTDPDIPIGYDARYEFRQSGVLFPEGSRIVLYTDGITEARNAERQFLTTERLIAAVGKPTAENVGTLTQRIVDATRQFVGNAEQRDDMTLMCIGNDTEAQSPTLVIHNDIEELKRVKPLLREYCNCAGCDRRQAQKITLATEEALSNIINYAYPKGEIGTVNVDFRIRREQDGPTPTCWLDITLADRGKPFNPLDHQQLDVEQTVSNRQVGGLGIYLFEQLMDRVAYERTADGQNRLCLSKEIKQQK